jgi:addiction module HigA family antidote
MTKDLNNPHPGEILHYEFLEPLGMSQNALARAIEVPANRISELVRGRRGVTADTDLRLARYFGLSEGYWLRLQNAYDLMEARRDVGKIISRINPYPIHENETDGVFA